MSSVWTQGESYTVMRLQQSRGTREWYRGVKGKS